MNERTIGAIALGPTGNATGSYWFMNLITGRLIDRQRFDEPPMPEDVKGTVAHLARRSFASFTFAWRDGMEIKDTLEEINDGCDSDKDPDYDPATDSGHEDDDDTASTTSDTDSSWHTGVPDDDASTGVPTNTNESHTDPDPFTGVEETDVPPSLHEQESTGQQSTSATNTEDAMGQGQTESSEPDSKTEENNKDKDGLEQASHKKDSTHHKQELGMTKDPTMFCKPCKPELKILFYRTIKGWSLKGPKNNKLQEEGRGEMGVLLSCP